MSFSHSEEDDDEDVEVTRAGIDAVFVVELVLVVAAVQVVVKVASLPGEAKVDGKKDGNLA